MVAGPPSDSSVDRRSTREPAARSASHTRFITSCRWAGSTARTASAVWVVVVTPASTASTRVASTSTDAPATSFQTRTGSRIACAPAAASGYLSRSRLS